MRHRNIRVGARYLAYILMLVTLATITNNNLSHMIVMDGYSDNGIPQPLATKPKWCSKGYQVQENDSAFVEDLLAMPPPSFERNYKNPCFYDSCHYMGDVEIKKLRCLPYFHVLGVDKCGSTDLFGRIAKHPQVLPNNGVLGKETMWWSWKRYGFWLLRNLTARETFDDYLAYFDNASAAIASRVVDNVGGRKQKAKYPYVTGDGTPMDFWDFAGWPMIPQNEGLVEPTTLTPHLINHINPNAKFILIFREPAERLYSDYMFLGIGNSSHKYFHKRVEKSISRFQRCARQKSLRRCLFSRELHVTLPVRLYVGMYGPFLVEWLKVFPLQQFLFLRTEDYAKDINGTLEEVFRFLDLEPVTNSTLEQISSATRAHETVKKKIVGKMPSKTKRLLKKFYAPYNRQLTALVNDLKFLWEDV